MGFGVKSPHVQVARKYSHCMLHCTLLCVVPAELLLYHGVWGSNTFFSKYIPTQLDIIHLWGDDGMCNYLMREGVVSSVSPVNNGLYIGIAKQIISGGAVTLIRNIRLLRG